MDTKSPETAIIIRTRNEERWIGEVLDRLSRQTYQNFEVIIVDSGSTDRTLEITSKYPTKLVEIKPEEFTYPHALNTGIRSSSATGYYVMLSAHSLPISEKWLEVGIAGFSKHSKVMGVYGPLLALPDATLWDRCFYSCMYTINLFRFHFRDHRVIKQGKMGVLGFTNAIIRKDLWEQYPLNESFAGGGEDGDWAGHWFVQGYVAVNMKGFTVRHSHYLGFRQWVQQINYWAGLSRPQAFHYLEFRNDPSHR